MTFGYCNRRNDGNAIGNLSDDMNDDESINESKNESKVSVETERITQILR